MNQNQQNRSQRNRYRSEPTDESEPAEPITERNRNRSEPTDESEPAEPITEETGTDPNRQMNQNQQNRSQRNRNRSEPTDESEPAEPITEEPEPIRTDR